MMKLGLGTVQFGLDYGVSNLHGKTPAAAVGDILRCAQANGVTVLDTAHLYGDSEEVLGQHLTHSTPFKIITKTPKHTEHSNFDENMRRAYEGSLEKLQRSSLYGLLFHDAEDLTSTIGGKTFKTAINLKEQGLLKKLGVSVYDEKQIRFILTHYDIDIVQLPLNVFDQRLIKSGLLHELKKRNIEVHTRSAFLQGIVFMRPQDIPVTELRAPLESFLNKTREAGLSPAAAALGFVSRLKEVDNVICGVNTVEQLQELCEAIEAPQPEDKDFYDTFAIDDDKLVNPANW